MDANAQHFILREHPRVMVVDGSRVVRKMLDQLLRASLPGVEVVACETGTEAMRAFAAGAVDFLSTALRLPDMDGMELAKRIREQSAQVYMPIVVVSGDVDERLISRELSEHVTDYFDKGLGFAALTAFIRGYVRPQEHATGDVLYVEDSRVVAAVTLRILEKHGFTAHHVATVEAALDFLRERHAGASIGLDVVLSDVTLSGKLNGADLIDRVRAEFGYGKGELPILIMSGDSSPQHQAALLRAGANDIVLKPAEERMLVTKLAFQTRLAQNWRARHTAGKTA